MLFDKKLYFLQQIIQQTIFFCKNSHTNTTNKAIGQSCIYAPKMKRDQTNCLLGRLNTKLQGLEGLTESCFYLQK